MTTEYKASTFQVTKTYGHEQGFSCSFRQMHADSHCRFLHGYALSFSFTFECEESLVDKRNLWVIDYGGLKPLKQFLVENFDHTTWINNDDPHLETFLELHERGLINMCLANFPTSCEGFAWFVADRMTDPKGDLGKIFDAYPNASLKSVTVSEHAGNSATYVLGD